MSAVKPRIVALLVIVAVITAMAAAGGAFVWRDLALLAVSGGLASAGASLLNNYRDRDIDAVMERTKNRALARGRINATAALWTGVALLGLGTALGALLNLAVMFFVLAGGLVYAGIYSWWLKRRTSWNIVIGGLAGSFAVLAGWYAGASSFGAEPLLLAAILFVWTPYHFWSFSLVHQESYRKAGVPMLPLVVGNRRTAGWILLHGAALAALSVTLFFLGDKGALYLVGVALCGAMALLMSWRLYHCYDRKTAWRNYKLSGIYLLGLYASLLVDLLV